MSSDFYMDEHGVEGDHTCQGRGATLEGQSQRREQVQDQGHQNCFIIAL